jgi:hypothetical protein
MPHHHQHPPGQHPPPPSISPSILRLSALQRIGFAAGLSAVLWAVVYWATA